MIKWLLDILLSRDTLEDLYRETYESAYKSERSKLRFRKNLVFPLVRPSCTWDGENAQKKNTINAATEAGKRKARHEHNQRIFRGEC